MGTAINVLPYVIPLIIIITVIKYSQWINERKKVASHLLNFYDKHKDMKIAYAKKPAGFCQMIYNSKLKQKQQMELLKCVSFLSIDFIGYRKRGGLWFREGDWKKRIEYLNKVKNGSIKRYTLKERFYYE